MNRRLVSTADRLAQHRSGRGPHPRADAAADLLRDTVGSWRFLTAATATLAVAITLTVRQDRGAGPVAVLGLLLAGLSTTGLVVVLMVASRAAKKSDRRAEHGVESARRTAAAIADLQDEVDRLRADVARMTARLASSRVGDRS